MKTYYTTRALTRALSIIAFSLPTATQSVFAASIPAAADSSTTTRQTVTTTTGKASVISVSPTQKGLVRFDLAQLPANYTGANITGARLRLYVSRLIKPGPISIHFATQEWSESVAGAAPTFDATPIVTIDPDQLGTKRFVIVDVTPVVASWLTTPASNFGFVIVSSGATPTAKVSLGSKEGPANGFPAELEVEATNGAMNSVENPLSVIGGGENNAIDPDAQYSTIPGGLSNRVQESFSFAAGRRAVANHVGSFIWADSTNADFSSTADNQFSIRATNGFFIANDAGGAKVVPVGTRYRDNAIVAWARVTSNGALDTNFNVASVTRVSTGRYSFTLNSALNSGFSLIPVVTPEIDPDGLNNVPVGAANVRIPATNQVASGSTFEVYMYNGNFQLVDNDFQVLVTGR